MTKGIIPNTLAPHKHASFGQTASLNLLILDDDRSVRDACRDATCSMNWLPIMSDSPDQALWVIESRDIDVVLLGLRVSDSARLQRLRQIKQKRPGVEVVIMTASAAAQPAVEAMKAGACDCLVKPFGLEELRLILDRLAIQLRTTIASRKLGQQIKSSGFGGMIGGAPEMDRLYRIVSKAAQSVHPVLILGESGTGKELVARAIHQSGPFHDKPFVPIDCGSLVPSLIESELFGHVKGAFTGAAQSREGLLALAEGGTVFLDEIGELALDLQAKLLRALQAKEIRPVGGTNPVPINVRILAATNRDLEQAVGAGTFRHDLYFRLNVLNVHIPPLRERRGDISLLATHFLERDSRASRRSHSFSGEAMQALLAYDWPGNVRELENCIERCCAMNSGPVIHTADLPHDVVRGPKQDASAPAGRITRIADLEREAILAAIRQLNGDKLMAARLLGIGKTTLYRKLKQFENWQ